MDVEEPNRRRHRYAQRIDAPPEKVFPLLCPVREVDWSPGWIPERVLSRSGVCEQDCIFITPPELPSDPRRSVWVVSRYEPATWTLQMYRVAPEHTVAKLDIELEGAGDSTIANIAYEITAIGESGDRFMREFTKEWYEGFMLKWEAAMNHYLKTGTMIRSV